MISLSGKYYLTENAKYTVYTDGASRNNGGHSGAGVLIIKNNKAHKKISKYLGKQTNNYAEYAAVIIALKELVNMKAINVEMYLDSNLVVNQLNGKWKIKNKDLKPLYDEAVKLKSQIKNIKISHVYREKNKEADKLANIGIDNKNQFT